MLTETKVNILICASRFFQANFNCSKVKTKKNSKKDIYLMIALRQYAILRHGALNILTTS